MSPELQAEWDALNIEHIELQRAHQDLHGRRDDRAAHVAHGQRLRAHIARLQDFATRWKHEHREARAGGARGETPTKGPK